MHRVERLAGCNRDCHLGVQALVTKHVLRRQRFFIEVDADILDPLHAFDCNIHGIVAIGIHQDEHVVAQDFAGQLAARGVEIGAETDLDLGRLKAEVGDKLKLCRQHAIRISVIYPSEA